MSNHKENLKRELEEVEALKVAADKKLLTAEVLIGLLSMTICLVTVFAASFVEMDAWLRICLIVCGVILFAAGMLYALVIEQTAGYYECKRCGHGYVPKFSSVLWAMHMGRTRYMKCPKCQEKSWQKKVLTRNR